MNVQLPLRMDKTDFSAGSKAARSATSLIRDASSCCGRLARSLADYLQSCEGIGRAARPEQVGGAAGIWRRSGARVVRFPDVIVDIAGGCQGFDGDGAGAHRRDPFTGIGAGGSGRQGRRISAAAKSCGLSRIRPGPDESMGLDARTCGLLFRAGRTGRQRCGSGSKHWVSICP